MEIVLLDLKKYLKKNSFPSKTVLIFPPFNGFRRFLIHKLIEDYFSSAEVAAFSIGQDINRRIVVCYKGLVRTDQIKATKKTSSISMIETEGPNHSKSSPSVAVYRPPAARIAEARQKAAESIDLSKRSRMRRPDQQMYVPRPKRASFGTEPPRSRSRSSSETSQRNDTSTSRRSNEDSIVDETNEITKLLANEEEKLVTKKPSHSPDDKNATLPLLEKDPRLTLLKKNDSLTNTSAETATSTDITDMGSDASPDVPFKSSPSESTYYNQMNLETNDAQMRPSDYASSTETSLVNEMLVDCRKEDNTEFFDCKSDCEVDCNESLYDQEITADMARQVVTEEKDNTTKITNNVSSDSCKSPERNSPKLGDFAKLEAMETVSLSSESKDSITSTDSSDSSNSSTDAESVKKQSRPACRSSVNMEISSDSENQKIPLKLVGTIQDNLKLETFHSSVPVTDDVLVISDSSSSSDNVVHSKEKKSAQDVTVVKKIKKSSINKKIEKSVKKNNNTSLDSLDWESLYDDSGECLVPDLMEELTNSVGRVRVENADSDYRPYQSIEERTNDGECVIEIYDFPAEFKTTDLMNIFAAYRNKNFQLKWVDDTHALGVFPSPIMADEILACTLPFVKTRPLRLGIAESRNKARNLILPPLPSVERPKTCTALARRLVTGALGLRLPTSSQDREKEKKVLKEAREKRRLEARQREAAWDGTLTSTNCI